MRLHIKTVVVFLVVVIMIAGNALTIGYGYSTIDSVNESETVSTGEWTRPEASLGPDFSKLLTSFIQTQIDQDPNSPWIYIQSQTDTPENQVLRTSQKFSMWGYEWKLWSKGKTANYPTMGYYSLIDRTVDDLGTPIHDINPLYSDTPLYPMYDYYKAFDAWNTATNNLYSLRLNYNTRIFTAKTVGQVANVSFYAMIGLSDPDDPVGMRDNQKLYVEVSPDGGAWTKIGTITPSQVTSSSEEFDFYSFDVPAGLLGQELRVRIRYNGRALNVQGEISYGRCIIDELEITML